jgi:hypothetical protein
MGDERTTRQFLYRAAGAINNGLRAPIDIVTVCGFMTDDEIRAHLRHYFAQLDGGQKLRVLSVMREGV